MPAGGGQHRMDFPFSAAVGGVEGALALFVSVAASAREARFPDGYDPWRKRIGVRVTAPPSDGLANREVCAIVRDFLGATVVEVQGGHTSVLKTLRVVGPTREEALRRLAREVA